VNDKRENEREYQRYEQEDSRDELLESEDSVGGRHWKIRSRRASRGVRDGLSEPYDEESMMTSNNFYFIASFNPLITEYLVNITKRRAFWSLNEDILKSYSEDQYAVSIKEDTTYPCMHSPKTTKETSSICRIQRSSIPRIQDIVCEYSGRYQMWSLLQETIIDFHTL
ncbi:hypothetical protein Tco_0230577, partial [Tanacetum coccineum]